MEKKLHKKGKTPKKNQRYHYPQDSDLRFSFYMFFFCEKHDNQVVM